MLWPRCRKGPLCSLLAWLFIDADAAGAAGCGLWAAGCGLWAAGCVQRAVCGVVGRPSSKNRPTERQNKRAHVQRHD